MDADQERFARALAIASDELSTPEALTEALHTARQGTRGDLIDPRVEIPLIDALASHPGLPVNVWAQAWAMAYQRGRLEQAFRNPMLPLVIGDLPSLTDKYLARFLFNDYMRSQRTEHGKWDDEFWETVSQWHKNIGAGKRLADVHAKRFRSHVTTDAKRNEALEYQSRLSDKLGGGLSRQVSRILAWERIRWPEAWGDPAPPHRSDFRTRASLYYGVRWLREFLGDPA